MTSKAASAYAVLGDTFDVERSQLLLYAYKQKLRVLGYRPECYPDLNERLGGSILRAPRFESLSHVAWMCEKAEELIDCGQVVNACRMIGFIQGALFMNGIYSLAEIQMHSKFNCFEF
ncbi:MAG: hypothetical protein ACYCX5_10745 [Coriobacteriia bacterium]